VARVADAAADVGAVLDAIGKHWQVADDVEVTLEANPTSVEATRFRGYRAAGVNRVFARRTGGWMMPSLKALAGCTPRRGAGCGRDPRAPRSTATRST